jgi:succinylglutamic semialdehyde dehydrogenase
MTEPAVFIGGTWSSGRGARLVSNNPATNEVLWQGQGADEAQVTAAVDAARGAFGAWARTSFDERVAIAKRYQEILTEKKQALAEVISKENGKPLWDSLGELTAMANKISISIDAYHERTPTRFSGDSVDRTALRHRAHGVLAVFGPFNFPGHLANGHIVPALLAGNTIIFKPSDLTPQMGEEIVRCWIEAGLPPGVINLVQGGIETGQFLAQNKDIDGLLFTGSAHVGQALHRQFGGQTEKVLALELGGNNPLIVDDVSDLTAAALVTVQSAFLTSGQRCTCARRLIVPQGESGDAFLDALQDQVSRVIVGPYDQEETPFMGPVINNQAAEAIVGAKDALVRSGGVVVKDVEPMAEGLPFLSPGLIDVTDVSGASDDEIFGPLLQIIRVKTFDEALERANDTRFGLAAGLLSDNEKLWQAFLANSRAGIVNWNKALTGASSAAPFGGIGLSGNHRPSAYYAADYCAYPVASMESSKLTVPETAITGLRP